MSVTFRRYSPEPFFSDDYRAVRDFLIRINSGALQTPNFTWGRWEWMITHGGLDRTALDRFGLWEEGGRIVALACYESNPGEGYFCLDGDYPQLREAMLGHAEKALSKDGRLRVLLPESDRAFQRITASHGFRTTQGREHIAAIDITGELSYTLPNGFRITDMSEGWDYGKYHRCMWRGFNHEGSPPEDGDEIAVRRQMLSSPMVNPELVLAVVAPNGDYVSHCGMWYREGDGYAYVEPVATDPDYRMMGLGKAAVLEGVIRCGKLGAKQALVGSSQQFYYNIGFYPIHTENWWELKL